MLSVIPSFATVMGSPSDFSALSQTVTFEPRGVSRKCIAVNITDDRIVEEREYFNVTLQRTGGLDARVQFGQIVTTIFINDNDSMMDILDAVVGLSSNAYYISSTAEDGQVCVRVSSSSISCPITFPFDIFFNFTDETAGLLCYTVLYYQ